MMPGREPASPLRQLMGAGQRHSLARLPTPIQRLPRLGKMLGAEIFCKRDDLTGFGFGGNKIRKLEYLLQDATDARCDSLVTCGSNQSNWCCMVSVAGAVLGLDVYLVLGGPVPKTHTGNLRLERLAGAKISHIDTFDDAVLEEGARDVAASLVARGRHPYRMIMGGSTPLGSLGYVDALREVAAYERAEGVRFSQIFHAAGSAGTQAGLVAGSVLEGWEGDIVGLAVSRSSGEQKIKVCSILAGMLDDPAAYEPKVIVDDGYVGAGYRQRTDSCAEALEIFARVEGIFLDEVYTGKAAAGLIDYARSGRFRKNEPVLFLHTGGTAQLFE